MTHDLDSAPKSMTYEFVCGRCLGPVKVFLTKGARYRPGQIFCNDCVPCPAPVVKITRFRITND